MIKGRYVYCILEGEKKPDIGNIGLFDTSVYTIGHKDLNAIVSAIPFKEMQANVNNIVAHQRVVEASRKIGTTLPVRFGVIIKTEDGVKNLLVKSYKDFRSKITKFKDKDEFGVRVIFDKNHTEKIKHSTYNNSDEIKKIKKEMSSVGDGSAYFLKMKMDEAIKNEKLKKIDNMVGEIHNYLAISAEDTRLLKTDIDQVVLNASYLIKKKDHDSFNLKLKKLQEKYKNDGLTFHLSGPWAPYSFC
ncbi:MAG TPA: GvpL/GvpF family gas vesicle protein [Nitrosopumilaceae archaeon]|nr:GvpL/GvpF family gas vesicle protein [Nitrosopumilaceae archaeon]